MSNPLVTIIVICYNHAEYLEKCILSIYQQDYRDIELIVADDFSKDGSRELLAKLSIQHGFLYLPNKTNTGLNYTIENALNNSHGEFLSVISADDYIAAQKISQQIAFIAQNAKDGVYASGFSVNGSTVEPLSPNAVFNKGNKEEILKYVYTHDWGAPLLQSGLFKKKVFTELAALRKEYKSDDWAFIIRACEQYDIGFMEERLFYYRLHQTNTHKRYWFTFPMRIDIVSRLVPEKYRFRAFGNIMLSQGQYLMADKKFFRGLAFFFSSLLLNFSFTNIFSIMKDIAVFFRDFFMRKSNSKNSP